MHRLAIRSISVVNNMLSDEEEGVKLKRRSSHRSAFKLPVGLRLLLMGLFVCWLGPFGWCKDRHRCFSNGKACLAFPWQHGGIFLSESIPFQTGQQASMSKRSESIN